MIQNNDPTNNYLADRNSYWMMGQSASQQQGFEQLKSSAIYREPIAVSAQQQQLSPGEYHRYIASLKEHEYESILTGKQNEIEYWKNKQLKAQRIIESGEVQAEHLSKEYDNLREQLMVLDQQAENQKYPLEQQLRDNQLSSDSIRKELASISSQETQVAQQLQQQEQLHMQAQLKVNDLKNQINQLQNRIAAQSQEDTVKRAAKQQYSQELVTPAKSRVSAFPSQSVELHSDSIKRNFQIIDEQNQKLQYQSEILKEKDQQIEQLRSQLLNANQKRA